MYPFLRVGYSTLQLLMDCCVFPLFILISICFIYLGTLVLGGIWALFLFWDTVA